VKTILSFKNYKNLQLFFVLHFLRKNQNDKKSNMAGILEKH
jgi:hypothetical protein